MSFWREELHILLSNEDNSLFIWVKILNFFEKNKTELAIEDVRKIVDKIECCRLYFNEHTKYKDVIEKDKTNPNVYLFLEELEAKQQPTTDSGGDTDLLGEVPALAI